MQPDLFNSTKGTSVMWSKIFSKKLEASVETIIAQEIKTITPQTPSVENALEAAKTQAINKVAYELVEQALVMYYAKEEYEQSAHAIDLFANLLLKNSKNYPDEVIFEEVRKRYPKAKTYYETGSCPRFLLPKLSVHSLVQSITDKVIAEIAEMD